MNKEERIEIYKDTVELVNEGNFKFQDEMVNGTKFYNKKINVNYDTLKRYETEIKVVDNDCLYEAHNLITEGYKPAVLNMASFHTPGGGVVRGSAAQEESIFRRTNIFKSLYQFHDMGKNYGVDQREERYPLDFNFGGIYTPNVTVFRASESDSCNLLGVPYYIDVISVPAVKKPPIKDGKIEPWVSDVIKNKIRQILDMALENGNDSLVLSAFGCGAYGTPPEEMAQLFKKVLTSDRYNGLFKVIVFAIINLPSTNGEHNPNGNFKPFKEAFEL